MALAHLSTAGLGTREHAHLHLSEALRHKPEGMLERLQASPRRSPGLGKSPLLFLVLAPKLIELGRWIWFRPGECGLRLKCRFQECRAVWAAAL